MEIASWSNNAYIMQMFSYLLISKGIVFFFQILNQLFLHSWQNVMTAHQEDIWESKRLNQEWKDSSLFYCWSTRIGTKNRIQLTVSQYWQWLCGGSSLTISLAIRSTSTKCQRNQSNNWHTRWPPKIKHTLHL